ncbi:MAG: TIGR00180 family glycosyltransferase [Bacteroidota bacterium]|nr:TIGR00180 family glycosyltransferase [Bacteroidota bacterium]
MVYKENTTLLNKLTLVNPTYNRQDFALRLMRYWSGREPRVIIIDGSNESIPAQQLSNLDSNISYYHIPENIVTRIGKVLNLIDTEYVALIADDEFHLPGALHKSIEWLEIRTDYVACMGRAMGFGIDEDGKVIGHIAYPDHKGYEITNTDPASRMLKHMRHYTPSTIYSVVRSKEWINSFKAYVAKEFPIYAIGELQFELSICYFGKSIILPYLHWLRSSENIPNPEEHLKHPDKDISLNPGNQFYLCWSSPTKKEFREEFLKITSETLAKTDGRDIKIVSDEVERAMDAYAELSMNWDSAILSNGLKPKIKTLLKKYLPLALKVPHALRTILSATDGTGKPKSLISSAKDIERGGVLVDYEALKEIENIVFEFHQKKFKSPTQNCC